MGSARLLSLLALTMVWTHAVFGQTTRPRASRPGIAAGSELVVIATDYAFEAPEQVDAGLVNIRLFNRGKEMHHVVVIKVDRLERIGQISDILKANRWNETWMQPLGGPEAVNPGGVSTASMMLEPGRYVLACVVSSPSTHKAHFMDGMIRELSVVKPPAAPVRAALPAAETSLTLFEWNFTLEGPLFAGRRTIRVENIGKFEHHAWVVRLLPGKTIEQATRWAEDPTGAAPFEPVGGTTGLMPGHAVNVTMDFAPGDYALLCTLFNPLSRKTHSAHGMIKPFRVVN